MEETTHLNVFQRVIDVIGKIFMPVIDIMCASGLLKGLLTILSTTGLLGEGTITYQTLAVLSDAFFYFLPIFLAISASKVFQVNQFSALLLAAFLVHPQLIQLFDHGNERFLGLPVQNAVYTSSVLPIIFAIWMMKYVEKFLSKYIHASIRGMFLPLFTLLIMMPVTLVILGPIGNSIATYVTYGYNYLIGISLVVGMAFLAGLFPVFVMLGISTAMVPIILSNLALDGYDTILISLGCSLFALAGMSLAVYLNSDGELKAASLSGVITALLGIAEPSVFGVGLIKRKAFIVSMVASFIGGGIVGFFHSQATAFIIPNVVTLPAYIGQPGFIGTIIGCFVPFVISFGVNFVLLKKNKV